MCADRDPQFAMIRPEVLAAAARRRRIIGAGVLIALVLLIAQCFYYGDGHFHRSGWWPFVSYFLDFDPIDVEPGKSEHYRIRNWLSNTTTWVTLKLTAPHPTSFEDFDLVVVVTMKDSSGNIVLSPAPDVFGHLKRMRTLGNGYYPDEEWNCRFDWGDRDENMKVVPFVAGRSPVPHRELECNYPVELKGRIYELDVRCLKAPPKGTMQLSLSFASGWK